MKNNEVFCSTSTKDNSAILAGIAHDFCSLNIIILGNISMLKQRIDENDEFHKFLSDAEEGVKRAKNLGELLLSHIAEKSEQKELMNLYEIIHDTADFLLRNTQVKVEFKSVETNLEIIGFKSQIKSVFRNIILNAEQAMPHGGTIRISATELFLSNDNFFSLSAGNYVKLIFKDEGIGIPDKNINKIFDTYFTTKSEGHGLGLAVCQLILHEHQGYICFKSEKHKGTAFTILLPMN